MKPKLKKEKQMRPPKSKKSLIDYKWVATITVLAFLISLCFSVVSQTVIPNVQVVISIILVLVVILIGVVFDMVGVAVTVADKKVFHAMAAKKVRGAKLAIKMINNAPKVSSLCCYIDNTSFRNGSQSNHSVTHNYSFDCINDDWW